MSPPRDRTIPMMSALWWLPMIEKTLSVLRRGHIAKFSLTLMKTIFRFGIRRKTARQLD